MRSSLNPMRSRWGKVEGLSQSHKGAAHHQRGLYPCWSSDFQILPAYLTCVWSHCHSLWPSWPAFVTWYQPAATCKSPIFSLIWSSKLYLLLERRTRLNVILSAALTLPPALTIFLNFEQNTALTAGPGMCLRSARQEREAGRKSRMQKEQEKKRNGKADQ